MTADLVIRGGTVVDGTGSPGRRLDVAITGDRISGIGSGLTAERVVDATGRVVAPGFIDIHTHYDAQVFWDPALSPSCYHGVTSVIVGNCGFSVAPCRPADRDLVIGTLERVEDMDASTLRAGVPWDFETFPEFLGAVASHGSVLNFGSYVPHSPLRLYVMGPAAYERAATSDEVEAMCGLLREGLDHGGLGFATSMSPTHFGVEGKPVPSRHADPAELMALASVLGEMDLGVLMVSGPGEAGLPFILDVAAKINRPVSWTSIHSSRDGSHFAKAQALAEGRAKGLQLWPQITNRPMRFELVMHTPFILNVSDRFAALLGESADTRLRHYADREFRSEAKRELDRHPLGPLWDTWTVVGSKVPGATGRMLVDIAADRACSPLDAALDLAIADELNTRFGLIIANDDPEGTDFLLNQEGCTLGVGDAGAHVTQLCDAVQPTDLLSRWVRERGSISLERAIRKLTGEHADLFEIVDRGYLRPGAFADVVVFDPELVAPGPVRRVRDFPGGAERLLADEPEGITHIFVNGTAITLDGVSTHAELMNFPGRALTTRRGSRVPHLNNHKQEDD